jgi:hypothetical protein
MPTAGTSTGPADAETGLHVALAGVLGVRRLGQAMPSQAIGSGAGAAEDIAGAASTGAGRRWSGRA